MAHPVEDLAEMHLVIQQEALAVATLVSSDFSLMLLDEIYVGLMSVN